jgi:hypothetical protein
MFRTLTKYQDQVKEILKQMHEEVGSDQFATADDNHKKKMKTSINALQGIINYMSTSVVERKNDNDIVCERNGTKL